MAIHQLADTARCATLFARITSIAGRRTRIASANGFFSLQFSLSSLLQPPPIACSHGAKSPGFLADRSIAKTVLWAAPFHCHGRLVWCKGPSSATGKPRFLGNQPSLHVLFSLV